jgi:serine/threonine protein kinase
VSTVHTDLGRYRLADPIGSGGMAVVYLAEDCELHRRVAVKLLADNLAADESFRARFLREAQVAAQLSHPNIVHVYDIGADPAERPFIVMEYVDGPSLAEVVAREGPLALERVLAIARDCCAGLAYAHAAGLVHRDLKPHNLLVDRDGRVKIADFGIARSLDRADITLAGSVLGTAGYLAPEQARGEQVTQAADMYGLGVTLHQLATGHMPDPGAPVELVEPLRTVVARCLDEQPGNRPSAAEVGEMLEPGVVSAAGETKVPGTFGSPNRTSFLRTDAATRPMHRTTYTAPRTLVAPRPRPAPLTRSARHRLLGALFAVVIVALVIVLAATAGGSGGDSPAAHARRYARAVRPIPHGATASAQAHAIATWLRNQSR